MNLIIFCFIGFIALSILILFLLILSVITTPKNNSKFIISHFESDNNIDDSFLSAMIEYHKEHGTVRYEI